MSSCARVRESKATLGRMWGGPTGRTVQISHSGLANTGSSPRMRAFSSEILLKTSWHSSGVKMRLRSAMPPMPSSSAPGAYSTVISYPVRLNVGWVCSQPGPWPLMLGSPPEPGSSWGAFPMHFLPLHRAMMASMRFLPFFVRRMRITSLLCCGGECRRPVRCSSRDRSQGGQEGRTHRIAEQARAVLADTLRNLVHLGQEANVPDRRGQLCNRGEAAWSSL